MAWLEVVAALMVGLAVGRQWDSLAPAVAVAREYGPAIAAVAWRRACPRIRACPCRRGEAAHPPPPVIMPGFRARPFGGGGGSAVRPDQRRAEGAGD